MATTSHHCRGTGEQCARKEGSERMQRAMDWRTRLWQRNLRRTSDMRRPTYSREYTTVQGVTA
jgi:hypothetical protein